MGLATSIALIGAAKGIYDTVKSSEREKAIQGQLDGYQRKTLDNAYKNTKLVSTIGTNIMREESSRNMATAMNSLGSAGTRAIIGAAPKTVAEQNNVGRTIQQNLDEQIIKANYAIAGDDVRVKGMQEQRENADLAGLGNAINVANQDANTGMNTALNAMFAMGGFNKKTDSASGNYDNAFKSEELPAFPKWTPTYKF
jgi:hypothetical protein